MDATTAEKVKAILSEQIGCTLEEATDSATLYDDLGADSLDSVELCMAIEEGFQIEIPDEAWKFETVGELVQYVEGRVGG